MMLLLLVLLAPQLATPPDSLFATGNRLYDAGDYEAARQAYLDLLGQGYASAALYGNLGNTYYRLDSLPRAVQYYERGRAAEPDNVRLAHNLRMVRARLSLTDAPPPTPYWQAGWTWMHRYLPPTALFWAGFALFLAAAGVAARWAWTGQRTAWLRRGLLLLAPPALALLSLAFALSAGAGVVRHAVVLESVRLEAPPADAATPADAEAAVRAGQVVRLLQRSGTRAEVLTEAGAQGWLPAQMLGEI